MLYWSGDVVFVFLEEGLLVGLGGFLVLGFGSVGLAFALICKFYNVCQILNSQQYVGAPISLVFLSL